MATKFDKKENIRAQIISASQIYRNELAGRVFLYVIGEEYFEVVFRTDRFMHLTGVNSKLNAKDFYEKAKKSMLTTNQFYFDANHSYAGAKKKLPCLLILPRLTNDLVCVVKDMQTLTLTYKVGITNIDFTLGLTEHVDFSENQIDSRLLPRSLRVKDKAVENSTNAEFVDFIFSKDAALTKYDTIGKWDSNTQWFLSADFPQYCTNSLDNTDSINCVRLLVLRKISSIKTARTLWRTNF